MIKNFKIYTDLNDDKTYAYCTYELLRNRGQHKESFRIELLYTDKETGPDDFVEGAHWYEIHLTQSIESRRYKSDAKPNPVVFGFVSRGYDQHTILEFVGDCAEHREFLEQVGIRS